MKVWGLAITLLIALASLWLASRGWFQAHAFGALTLSILLGMLVGNTIYKRVQLKASAGVGFARKYLLQVGIVLYGMQISVTDLSRVGLQGFLIDTLVLTTTFALAYLVGKRVLGLEARTAVLIGAGSSICGAAAVLATESVTQAKPDQVAVAIATVLVFGTLSTLLYPALFHLNGLWHLLPTSQHWFGLFAGSTVHEVAQVVAATRPIGSEATDLAVITKMIRVMLLAPFLVLLALFISRKEKAANAARAHAQWTQHIPWFAFVFIGTIFLHSLLDMPSAFKAEIGQFDILLLSMAMGALGLLTDFSAIRSAGWRPLLLGGILFLWLLLGGGVLNLTISAILGNS